MKLLSVLSCMIFLTSFCLNALATEPAPVEEPATIVCEASDIRKDGFIINFLLLYYEKIICVFYDK